VELADFVLARIAEEEAEWVALVEAAGPAEDAARARLANCRARGKRVKQLRQRSSRASAAADTSELQMLALPYYDHPDYKLEWLPASTSLNLI
jgi:crotonobetainyl-CoA:carnitine CoA-transferase CaiB-like acyl-CoA transferase